ncbi:MAG: hypothetical protein J0L84_17770, partial [Verrucomicrobia bacterium]|nr:hypothetical protein [Verrucomicrobiota bacterium]
AGAALTTLATTTQSRTTFEYLVVKGIRPNDARDKNNSLDPRLPAAGAEGWEAVSMTQESENPFYFAVLLKRQKE